MITAQTFGIIDPWTRVTDIDPVQLQRWFDFIFKPNRASDGLYVLHEAGRIVSVTPTVARLKLVLPDVVDNPASLAESLYRQWQRGPVAVLERNALRKWFDLVQRDFVSGDDIFSLLLKAKNRYIEARDIVIFPDPVRNWADISPDLLPGAARSIAPTVIARSLVFAAYDGPNMWVSVLLGFQNGYLKYVTTLPLAYGVDWRTDHARLFQLAESLYAPVSVGIFCQRITMETLGIGPISWPKWLSAAQQDQVVMMSSTSKD
jgi:hypothetical protein